MLLGEELLSKLLDESEIPTEKAALATEEPTGGQVRDEPAAPAPTASAASNIKKTPAETPSVSRKELDDELGAINARLDQIENAKANAGCKCAIA